MQNQRVPKLVPKLIFMLYMQWKLDKDDHKWVATKSMEKGFVTPYLSETFTTIEGDPHGRCAGLFYLHHKDTKAKVSTK